MRLRAAAFSMSRPILPVLAAIIGLTYLSLAHGQEKPARLTFDVAVIRPSQPGVRGGGIKPLPGGNGYVVQNFPVKAMISLMYKVPGRQITGGPDWLNNQGYDIEAKADHAYSLDDLHLMFQNLLADRFNLKFHKEVREGPVYALVVDKSGSKMKVNDSPQDFKIPILPGPDNVFVGTRVPMQYFCFFLGGQHLPEEWPVIDKNGLSKNYDFTLSFLPDLPPDFPQGESTAGSAGSSVAARCFAGAAWPQIRAAKGTGGVLRYRPRRETVRELTAGRCLIPACIGGRSYRYQGIFITVMRGFPLTSRSSFSS
jgi:uncharacterized protein (TIGR03435 family)